MVAGPIPAPSWLVFILSMLQVIQSKGCQGRDYWCFVEDFEGTGLTKSRKRSVNAASASGEIQTGSLSN